MKKAFDKLSICYKCAVLSGLFLLLLTLCLIPCFIFGYMDIPLGFIVGFSYGILLYSIVGLYEDKSHYGYKGAITIIVVKYLVFGALLFLLGLCYYRWDVKLFNLFTVVGGYLIVLVIYVVLNLMEGKKERVKNGNI